MDRPAHLPPEQPAVQPRSAKVLFQTLRDFQLLPPAQMEELQRGAWRGSDDPKALVTDLLQRGWLTAYQINQLVLGRGPDLVVGPYVLQERLGDGGTGEVFKARHRKLQRIAAVKVVRRELLAQPEMVQRFYREVELLSRLRHPNIVGAYDAGPAGRTHFLAMEYVDGVTLDRLVKKGGPLPVEQAVAYITQAAIGLQHAAERGLVHRDVKPSNLMVAMRTSQLKILDLGLVQLRQVIEGTAGTGTLTESGTLMGTPDFMSPEQAENSHTVDGRADVYSLGATLYFILTGHVPFPNCTLFQKLVRLQQNEPAPVETLRPDVLPGLGAVVRKMMAKRPADRYQTPAEVAAALAAPGSNSGASATLSGTEATTILPLPETPPRRATRGLWAWAAGLAALVVLGSVIFWSVRGKPRASHVYESAPDLNAIAQRIEQGDANWPAFKQRLEEYLAQDSAAAEAPQARLLLAQVAARLASPLDALDRGRVPSDVVRYSPLTVAVLPGHVGGTGPLAFSPDGRLLASTSPGDNNIRLWDLTGPEPKERPPLRRHSAPVNGVRFTGSGDALISRSLDGTARLWDLSSPAKEFPPLGAGGTWVEAMDLSADGKLLACGTNNGTVQIWDIAGPKPVGRPTLRAHEAHLTGLAFSPDGKLLATGSHDRAIRLWHLKPDGTAAKGAEIKDYAGAVRSLAFSPDGQLLAAGVEEPDVRIWDVSGSEPKPRAPLKSDAKAQNLARFSPDGKTLVAVGNYGHSTVWDPRAGRLLHTLNFESHSSTAAWAPDSRHLALGHSTGNVFILRLAAPPRK